MTDDKKKVLFLDDEGLIISLYKPALEKGGYEVKHFFSGDDALRALRDGYEPDAIVFDLTMPAEKSGYEFIELVQKERLAKHALKIAFTNQGREGEIARTGELGVDAHLIKAKYTPAELVAKVTELLAKR